MNQLILNSMKRIYSFLFVSMAMLMLSINSAWAQYVKVTSANGTESWIEIEGIINGTNIEIYKGASNPAIDSNTKGSIDLNEVWSRSDGRGTHYQVTSIGDGAFMNCSGLTSITIPNSVTEIGESAFAGCSGMISVDIPSRVTSIRTGTFSGCSGLTSVTIGNGLTTIGWSAFDHCIGLTSVNIPSSVTSIVHHAFFGCSGLIFVVIPSSVTSIEESAFGNCIGLTSIIIDSGNSVYDSRNNCNAIIETASNTLITGCKNTKIPSSVTSIGNYAFQECRSLTSITIPNSVTSIGVGAFMYCSGLTSVVIPSSMTSIGGNAFQHCARLTSVTSYITEVFKTGTDAFNNLPSSATLYVPKGFVDTYKSIADWNSINNIEEIIPVIPLLFSCNNKGKVKINGGVQFTNDMGEVSVYDGLENTFVFTPEENCQLEQVLIDGLDVTLSVKNNQLTTKIRENSKMIVTFSKQGDMNSDGRVDISDVVALVNMILGQ